MKTFKQFTEDKMDNINIQQSLQGKPQAWIQAISRLPELLQREILEERPNPDQEDVAWVSSFQVANQPVKYNLIDLLKNPANLSVISRSPPNVVQEINKKWGLQVKLGPQFDQTPGRYQQYAQKFTGATAKPSGFHTLICWSPLNRAAIKRPHPKTISPFTNLKAKQ